MKNRFKNLKEIIVTCKSIRDLGFPVSFTQIGSPSNPIQEQLAEELRESFKSESDSGWLSFVPSIPRAHLQESFQNMDFFIHAFRGSLDKALLEAVDPYDVINRPAFSDEIWDMSLYKGKLYLYWGPIPALLLVPFQLILDKRITDNYLVFFFSAGLLIFNSLIILKLWKFFFTEIPAKYVFACIPLIGLITNLPVSARC